MKVKIIKTEIIQEGNPLFMWFGIGFFFLGFVLTCFFSNAILFICYLSASFICIIIALFNTKPKKEKVEEEIEIVKIKKKK